MILGTFELVMIRDQFVEEFALKTLCERSLQQEGFTVEKAVAMAQLSESALAESSILCYAGRQECFQCSPTVQLTTISVKKMNASKYA